MTSVDPNPTTTLTANLSRLGLTYTADSLNDLIARAARSRWSPTVLLDTLVQAELDARARRRLERQLQAARLGRFKPLADFEWTWPTLLHRPTVDRVFSLDFIAKGENVVLVASQGLGKPCSPRTHCTRRSSPANNRPDTPGTGRFAAMKEEVPSLPAHVIYRPKDLAALGGVKLGVVAWGNGGCSDDGASSRLHLLEIASHGYLVIASGRILSGPGAPPREPRPTAQPGQILPPRTKASDLTDALDWALAENARSGSPFVGRIDPALVAYSGWSCGGLQALAVAKDPRVKTMVLHNTGVLNDGPGAIPGMDVRKDVLTTLHTPTIYILGGPKDIAYANGMDDFARIAHVPVAVANLPVGHGGTFLELNGGAAASVAVSWLDWQLRGDRQSAGRFVGEHCGLCQDAQWSLQRKQFPVVPGGH